MSPARLRPGGLTVVAQRVAGPPVVAVRAWLGGGARVESLPGEALVAGRALTEGSERRDWRQIADDAEAIGAVVMGSASFEGLGVAVDALAADWRQAVEWAAELLLEPTFPAQRCDWVRRQAAAELESLGDLPDVRTAWAFLDQLYTPHRLALPLAGTAESLARLDAASCAAFHRRSLGRGACVVLTGEVDAAAAEEALRAAFARLSTTAPEVPAEPAAPPGEGPERVEVVLPPGDQAHLYAGCLTVPRCHPDLLALEVLGVVLGAGPGLSGRFPEAIRERQGLAYSVQVQTVSGAGLDPGRFAVYVGTAPETLAQAEASVREEVRRVAEEGVRAQEVEEARGYLLGREPFRRETARQWADLFGEAVLYGTTDHDPETRQAALAAVTLEAVNTVAARYLDPRRLRVTVGTPGV